MAAGVGAIDFEEIRALVLMTQRSEPFVAKIAKATLAVVESRRDAEIRAATAEAALATERATLAAVRHLIATLSESGTDHAEALRQVALLVM